MATEAQRLIGISLAKIHQSRCGRGGVSLHKNLLVATVLQKARYIFMEEAYHMVQGHYLHTKYHEPEIDTSPVDDDDLVDDNELDDIFNAPVSSIGKDEDSEAACDKENNPPDTPGLTYFDLDINRIQPRTNNSSSSSSSNNITPTTTTLSTTPTVITTPSSLPPPPATAAVDAAAVVGNTEPSSQSNNKRRREITEHETEEAVQSILPKRIKADVISTDTSSTTLSSSSSSTVCVSSSPASSSTLADSDAESLFNDDEFTATTLSENVAREFEELNNNSSNSNNNILNTSQQQELMQTGPAMEGIDRITSLVSIFSFGNLTRSVSTPDLCSAQAKDPSSESLPQRTYLAMTV